jgi:DNA-binding SARP family transcriptional activator/tetratricopeptide (TPR) repeat protein
VSGRSAQEHLDRTPAKLWVYMLGPPNVEWAGRAVVIPRRQARALLYRLAARLQPVPREHLCYLFWSDTDESTARRNLSRLLTHLRRALATPKVLVTSGDHVGLDPRSVWSDTAAFERLCAPQGSCRQATVPRHSSGQVLQRAVDLCRGLFLAGFSLPDSPEFETWVTLERETWEHLYLEALAALIEDRTVSGECAAAIAYARRYLATDDLAEDIHCRLIELYAATGDRSAALRQFEHCVAVLERELGVSPLPETQAAYRVVLAGETRFFPRNLVSGAPVTKPAWATLPGLDVPLVGREEALRQLEQAYARVRTGHGGVVLISGEPGIGKSRLMQDFATRLQGQVLVLAGAGYLDAQTMPYQPIIEALRPVLGVRRSRFHVHRSWLAEVSRLMPELCALYPDLPPPMSAEPGQARVRLFEALCQLILGLTVGLRPVLLCLDDLHWADSATLDWLAYLGRRLRGSRLLVIGIYRDGEADTVAELRRSLARQGILSELKLVGLEKAAVLQLLRHLARTLETLRIQGDEALASRLRRVTGGNPFFLLEMLRTLIEPGRWLEDLVSLEDLPLPDTVRDAVEARVECLSSKARQVLEAGAVLGQTFAFNTVHLTVGRREMETIEGLDELVARQLLREQTSGYWFRHEIVRAAVYRDLSQWRRRRLHRRAGEALEKLRPGDAAALFRHFACAEESGRAAKYALQAGRAAKAVFAHSEACAYFDRALALLEEEAAHLRDPEAVAANQRLQIQVLYERGWALRLVGDMGVYARDSQEVARLAKALGDQHALAHLRWREAYTHRWFCRYAEAREAAEEGLRLSQAIADRLLEARCQREVGLAARTTGDYDRARAALERALSLFVELDEAVYEVHSLGNLSTLHLYLGEPEQALDLARQALARCDQAKLPLERRLPLGDMGAAAAAAGDVDLAQRCLLESLTIARQIADRTQEIFCLGHLGWLCVRLKQPAEALEHLQAALDLAESVGSCAEQSWLLSGLAEAHCMAGDLDGALAHARRALGLAQASGRAYDQGLARRILTGLRKIDL